MATYRADSILSKPRPNERVPPSTLEYFKTRNRMKTFSTILREFRKCGISGSELSKRTGKSPEVISRLLGSPKNLTLDTLSILLFGMSGAEMEYNIGYPLDKPQKNRGGRPEWLEKPKPTARAETQSAAPVWNEIGFRTPVSGSTASVNTRVVTLPDA
jgi:hypothetical protein